MTQAATSADDLSADVVAALTLSELDADTPRRLRGEGQDLGQVAVVLSARADLAAGFDIDIEDLAENLELSQEEVEQALETLQDPGSVDANPLLDAVGADRFLFDIAPTSIRDVAIDLPEPGVDPEVDKAVDRLDDRLLDSLLLGEDIDPADLSEEDREAMEVLAAAMGGDDVTVKVEDTIIVRGGRGDDESKKILVDTPITDLSTGTQLAFVQLTMSRDIQMTRLARALDDNPSTADDSAVVAQQLGLTEEEAERMSSLGNDLGDVARRRARGELTSAELDVEIDRLNTEISVLKGEFDAVSFHENLHVANGLLAGAAGLLASGVTAVALGVAGLYYGLTSLLFETDEIEDEIERKERERSEHYEDKLDRDFGNSDPRDTIDPNDPTDTGGNGLI